MRRLLPLILLVGLLLPSVATAQAEPPAAVDAVTFGDQWEARDPIAGGRGIPGVWDWRFTYVGPDGAVVTIDVYNLGSTMSDYTQNWQAAVDIWTLRVQFELRGPVQAVPATDSPFPFGATDALRGDDIDAATNEPAVIGLYALPDHEVALMVRVHGKVANRLGITAVNWVVTEWIKAQP